ncbi:MAG: CrcB family protein [Hyphomicrobiaceae bacterium]
MRLFLLAAAGGAIGAGARYLVNVGAVALFGAAFPWGTFFVTVVGSFLMGAVVTAAEPLLGGSALWRTFLATGILGGFTTLSAFSLDAYTLFERRQTTLAALYVVGTILVSIAALVAGLATTKALIK